MKLARAQTRQFTKNHSFKPSARTMSATIEFVLVMTITKVQVLRFLSRSVSCNSINGASSKEGGAGEASHQSSPLKCIALPLQDILSLSLAVMLTPTSQNSQMNPDKEGSCRMVQIPSPIS